jgi:(1->4)-alpha-D-glucan 1-alpha-D-glucosylmutase
MIFKGSMSSSAKQLDELVKGQRVPGATYRLQFNHQFTFAQASACVPYLRDLGITDCYASPLFQAGPNSTHGYDICSFELFNPVLGGRSEFDRFSAILREAGLGLLLDMVPNHMGADLSNRWWTDVLQHGRESSFASFFDIQWQPADSVLDNKILIPTLEDRYANVLEQGKLKLAFENNEFVLAYHDRRFPIAPDTYPRFHHKDPEAARSVCDQYNGQPGKPRTFDALNALIQQQHYRLAYWRVGAEIINYRRFFDVTQLVSVRMELPLVFRACHQLIFELLCSGQVTGLRIDHPDGLWDPKQYFSRLQAGFALTHLRPGSGPETETTELAVSEWMTAKLFPFEREEEHFVPERSPSPEALRSDRRAGQYARPMWPLYVLAEKILTAGEPLRRDWAIDGTTGYDFLNTVNGLFVDSEHKQAFDSLYTQFTGQSQDFSQAVYEGKLCALQSSFTSELNSLTHRLGIIASKTRYGQDFTFRELRQALTQVIAFFPVYRTYISSESPNVIASERRYLEEAVAKTEANGKVNLTAVLGFIQDILLLRLPDDLTDEARQLSREFVLRFQQMTGPVMAKGLEDTALYHFNRLISLNEVGGNPDRFGVSVADFHAHNLEQAKRWPRTLLATATHDTKRGEDVRARINVLSEIPCEWESLVRRWAQINAPRKATAGSEAAPDRNDEYFLYQTLVGAWLMDAPGRHPFSQRIAAYMRKASREAKVHTSWTDPAPEYEAATEAFVADILDPAKGSDFLKTFVPFKDRIAFFGQLNSLAQLLLKITCPGVPDFYQGTELWDLTLVDPDNRRPVDFEVRRQLLDDLRKRAGISGASPELVSELWADRQSGQIKLFIAWRALTFRQRLAALYSAGAYLPLQSAGIKARHVCAFARTDQRQVAITIVPRLVVGLTGGIQQLPVGPAIWQDTRVDLSFADLGGTYRNILTNESVSVSSASEIQLSSALAHLPIALLERTAVLSA